MKNKTNFIFAIFLILFSSSALALWDGVGNGYEVYTNRTCIQVNNTGMKLTNYPVGAMNALDANGISGLGMEFTGMVGKYTNDSDVLLVLNGTTAGGNGGRKKSNHKMGPGKSAPT